MGETRRRAERRVRAAGCAVLVALLAASGYWGASRPLERTVSVPVSAAVLSEQALEAEPIRETQERLHAEREQALALLQGVLDDADAPEDARAKALEKKTAMAERMETEAALCALLAHMGFGETAAVLGENCVSVVVPWQAAENEQSRARIVDAAASQTGLAPACVKIILAKK